MAVAAMEETTLRGRGPQWEQTNRLNARRKGPVPAQRLAPAQEPGPHRVQAVLKAQVRPQALEPEAALGVGRALGQAQGPAQELHLQAPQALRWMLCCRHWLGLLDN